MEYKKFVTNRVDKIQQHKEVTWHHFPTEENPADIGSRGGNAEDNVLWKLGCPTHQTGCTAQPRGTAQLCFLVVVVVGNGVGQTHIGIK